MKLIPSAAKTQHGTLKSTLFHLKEFMMSCKRSTAKSIMYLLHFIQLNFLPIVQIVMISLCSLICRMTSSLPPPPQKKRKLASAMIAMLQTIVTSIQ